MLRGEVYIQSLPLCSFHAYKMLVAGPLCDAIAWPGPAPRGEYSADKRVLYVLKKLVCKHMPTKLPTSINAPHHRPLSLQKPEHERDLSAIDLIMVSLEEPQGPPQGHLGGLPVDFNCKDFAVGPSLPPLVQGSLHGELELRLLTISWKPPQPRRGVAGASRRAPPPRQLAVRLRWWGEPAPPAEGAPGSHGTLFRPRTTPSGHSAVLERDPSNTALFPVRWLGSPPSGKFRCTSLSPTLEKSLGLKSNCARSLSG